MYRVRIPILFFLLHVCLLRAWAGGFQVNLQGIRAAGMGHVGAGVALDPSVMFFNPGALATLDGFSFSLNGFGVTAKIQYSAFAPDTEEAENEKVLATPFSFYLASPFLKRSLRSTWAAGLGVYTPYGSTVRYPDVWKGMFMMQELSLRTIFVQPTLSWSTSLSKSREKNQMDAAPVLGFGAGPVLALGSVSLKKGIPVSFSDGSYGQANLSGSGTGFGLNAGVFFKTRAFSTGLNFRSPVVFNANNGEANFTVPVDLQQYFPATTFSSRIVLPMNLTLGGSWTPSPRLRVSADVQFVGWHVYDTLSFDFADNTDKLADSHSPREYRDGVIFRLGGEWTVLSKEVSELEGLNSGKITSIPVLSLRAGIYADPTVVDDGFITPETPDQNKLGITLGASWSFSDYWSLDLCGSWVEGMQRDASNTEANFGGTWKARAFIFGVGITRSISMAPVEKISVR